MTDQYPAGLWLETPVLRLERNEVWIAAPIAPECLEGWERMRYPVELVLDTWDWTDDLAIIPELDRTGESVRVPVAHSN